MAFEIRPASAEEMESFGHVVLTSLVMPPEVFPPEVIKGIKPEWTLCAFADGKLATSYAAWPLKMQFNGNTIPVAGVTCVGTLPIYRGRASLGKVIAEHFRILHEQGERPIAALYATRAVIYQRFGYAVVSSRNQYDIDPVHLKFASAAPVGGEFRELKDDDFNLMAELYREFRMERTGYIHRGTGLWFMTVLHPSATPGIQLHKIIYEENGKLSGYVVYTSEPLGSTPGMPRHNITIRDLVWLTPSAYVSLWRYLSRMMLADRILWERVPPDDPLPHLLLEPRMLHLTSVDGLLARIVDVEKALPKRKYDKEAVLTFEIIDDLCPWNRGKWRLETGTDENRIERTEETPDMTLPVSTLGMLFFGQISASEAARMGRADVRDRKTLLQWDHTFRTQYRPFCADFF
jgi:predicted acetyltransferase